MLTIKIFNIDREINKKNKNKKLCSRGFEFTFGK